MSGLVLLVHWDAAFSEQLASALAHAGHEIIAFAAAMPALDVLDAGRVPDVLITCVEFPADNPTGLSLARMAMLKCPGIKVLFADRPESAELARGVGEFYPYPEDLRPLSDAVQRLLGE
jgi:hypothetical protein